MDNLWIKKCTLENFGKIGSLRLDDLAGINLIIGENGTGKTFLLKALYSAIRTMEEYMRGDANRSVNDILIDKLRWTFQVDKPGDIVTKGAEGLASCQIEVGSLSLGYQFGADCKKKLTVTQTPAETKIGNSVFIPAKEVLSLFSVISKSREVDQVFGFDDTYYDLVKALGIAPSRGKNYTGFAESRKKVFNIIQGKVDFKETTGKWVYKQGDRSYSIGATSEGVKKIAIMDRLLANGYLSPDSVLFIDEIESALHPDAICEFLEVVDYLAETMNIQVFISTHSYFVIKKVFLIALNRKNSTRCISLSKELPPVITNLSDGMPQNSIIDASIRLYEEEINGVL